LRQYENNLLGQTIIVVTDSATVTYYQKLKFGKQSQIRMLAYMSQFELSFLFTKGILNHIDFISRLAQNLDDHEKLVLMPEDRSDFIFAIEQRGKSEKSEEFSDQSAGSCGEWKTYTPQFDNVDNVLENECVLQHDLINCINQQDCFGADVTTPTTLLSQLNGCQQSEADFSPAVPDSESVAPLTNCNTDTIFDIRLRPQADEYYPHAIANTTTNTTNDIDVTSTAIGSTDRQTDCDDTHK